MEYNNEQNTCNSLIINTTNNYARIAYL